MADPDPMTCDPGSPVYDTDPGTVIPDPIYLVTTLQCWLRIMWNVGLDQQLILLLTDSCCLSHNKFVDSHI